MVTETGATPVYIASQNGFGSTVLSCVQSAGPAETPKLDGCAPIHIATHQGHYEVFNSCTNIDTFL